MDDVRLLAEVEELLRSMPPTAKLHHQDAENFEWLGRARAIVGQWNDIKAVFFCGNVDKLLSGNALGSDNAFTSMMTVLYEARADLKMKTSEQSAISVAPGRPFDYYDEVRKVIETAQIDLFIVDPYMDAGFVSRYLPHVRTNVTIRLLTRAYLPQLLPSVEQFVQQSAASVGVRKSTSHDRYLFIDRHDCFFSSASFKDGGKSAGAMLSPVTDLFAATQKIYEDEWVAASVVRP